MYSHIWKKYLPIIKILLKKSLSEQQVLNLNRIDFERTGSAKKAGPKFKIEFVDGKVGNIISGSALASHLAQVILEDPSARDILQGNHFHVSLNSKYELTIKHMEDEPV